MTERTATTRKVLIAGASGLVGFAATRHFASLPGWEAVGISRRTIDVAGATSISVDLADRLACERTFGGMHDVTHVVYAALFEMPGLMTGWSDPEQISRNRAMLKNLFDPLLGAARDLEHVSLLHGTKAYGIHHPAIGLRDVHIPLREREPRREHPNFYFEQEDYLREKQERANWGLTVFRPTVIYGDAVGNNMNPIPAIAAYAAILRERGEPLHFPGRVGAPVLREAVDADLVAHALAWAATSPAAKGGTYNLTNGDVFLWENVWPAIAESLGMAPGEQRPVSLAEMLPELDAEWAAIVDKYSLNAPRSVLDFVGANSLVYADMVLGGGAQVRLPVLNSTIAIRQAGFHECMDSEDMFRKWFIQLRDRGYFPS